MDVNEIKKAIEEQRSGLQRAIDMDRAAIKATYARVKASLAQIAELPRPPIKKAKKAVAK